LLHNPCKNQPSSPLHLNQPNPKIAGIKFCESYNRQYSNDYHSVMPTNLYGIGDIYINT
jgi:nucleoside-diphosphate-sugar epimerase